MHEVLHSFERDIKKYIYIPGLLQLMGRFTCQRAKAQINAKHLLWHVINSQAGLLGNARLLGKGGGPPFD